MATDHYRVRLDVVTGDADLETVPAVPEAQDGREWKQGDLARVTCCSGKHTNDCRWDDGLWRTLDEAVTIMPGAVVSAVRLAVIAASAAVREGERERLAAAKALNDAADQIEANARYEIERYGTTSGVYAVAARLRALAAPSLAAPEGTTADSVALQEDSPRNAAKMGTAPEGVGSTAREPDRSTQASERNG